MKDDILALLASRRGHKRPRLEAGWIPWRGGECPVRQDTNIRYRLRNGNEKEYAAKIVRWEHRDNQYDIIAYRVMS